MPFYEYQCRQCGAQTEVMQKISDRPLKKCPECAKNALVRLISAPVFRLKGGGWYETDFKSDQDRKRNLADSGGDSAAESSAKDSTAKSGADKSGAEKSSDTAGAGSVSKAADTQSAGTGDTSAKKPSSSGAKEKSAASGGAKSRRKPGSRKPVARSTAAP
jgi:putative FmdB family regulatory protein